MAAHNAPPFSWRDTLQQPFTQQVIALAWTSLAAFLFPAGLVLSLLLPAYRRVLADALQRAISERQAWFWLLAFGPVAAIAAAHPSPPDDLLRNLRAWTVDFDYRAMYWGSPGIQTGDYYLGFDWLIGWIDRGARLIGHPNESWLPVLLADALGWSVALAVVLRRLARDTKEVGWMVFAACVLLIWLVPNFTARVVSARPESFFALWAFCALAAESVGGVVVWTLTGLLLATWYWFFWIYVPAAVLLLPWSGWGRRAFLTRAVAAAVVFVGGMAFWLIASHGHYLGWFWHLHQALNDRKGAVSENEGLLMGLATPAAVALAGIALAAGAVRQKVETPVRMTLVMLVLLVAWFALPNMTRYTDSVISLGAAAVVLLAASKWKKAELTPFWRTSAALVLLGLFVWTALILGTGTRPMEDIALQGSKPGQKVLTWFGRSTYDAVYLNPGLRIAPAFEVGFSTAQVQKQSLALGRGQIDCAWLRENDVSWVIAPMAPINAQAWGQCLRLVKTTADGTSVWRTTFSR